MTKHKTTTTTTRSGRIAFTNCTCGWQGPTTQADKRGMLEARDAVAAHLAEGPHD